MVQAASDAVTEHSLEAVGTPGVQVVGRSPWQIFWGRFRRDRVAIAGALFIAALIFIAITAEWLTKLLVGHTKDQQFPHMTNEFGLPLGPTSELWFGADQVGRDLFVRVLYGARTSLVVAFFATGISVAIGVVMGVLAGYYRGPVDTFISRAIDVVMSLPILLFALGIAAACAVRATGCLGGDLQVPSTGTAGAIWWGATGLALAVGSATMARRGGPLGFWLVALGLVLLVLHLPVPVPRIEPGLRLVVFVIALVNWTYIARIVRGQVLSLREREFVEASRSLGSSNSRIMFKELLPNLAAPIIVYATLIIPSNILFEAALSFLGVGIPQTTPSWGRMLADASSSQIFTVAWWMMFFPGAFLLLTTLAFNLVGDGLRDALDPKGAR